MQHRRDQMHTARRSLGPRAEAAGGVKVCTSCRAVHFKKSWQHDSDEFRLERHARHMRVERVLCPACKMIAAHQFEGKLVIQDVPTHFSSQLINLILSFSKRAWKQDPEERLIEVRKDEKDIILTTTEDQLAVKLAKKVRDVFKRVRLDIHYGKHSSDATLVWLKFQPTPSA